MHIKSIKLKGFKSYREAVHVKDISPNHVALIGINGAGKSNFFEGTFEILFFFLFTICKIKNPYPFYIYFQYLFIISFLLSQL